MSNRPTYVDYNHSSPSSEKSVYFDAPLMHFFSKSDSKDATNNSTTADDTNRSGAASPSHDDHPQPAVTSPQTSEQHADNTSNDRPRRGFQLHDAPVDSRQQRMSDDSGYASPTRRAKSVNAGSALRSNEKEEEMKPIPVLWSGPPTAEHVGDNGAAKRASSLRSFRSPPTGNEDADSIRTDPSGRRTPSRHHRRLSMRGGSFVNGPGTIGPNAKLEPNDSFRERSETADSLLSKKEKLKISKSELKEGRRLAKVVKDEARAEQEALELAIRELSEIQKTQRAAVKEEEKTYAAHAKALRVFHKEEITFMAARARFEKAQGELRAFEEAREAARQHALDATDMLQEKNHEVEYLRAQKSVDDRERELKLRQLTGKK
ncbi:unnamed protein product [Somion occarium]|uniref:Uncharacterized protein n=1 Tax=Somion occarium TaxID=3059160 RepID=A0ABP1E9E5_9APHY